MYIDFTRIAASNEVNDDITNYDTYRSRVFNTNI